jgi:outer membrane receptor protein involved in Fe transport
MTKGFKATLVAGVALNVLWLMAGTAHAADAPVATDAATSNVGEVIVTAERRENNVLKVPLTVQAFTGQTLSKLNISTFDDLLRFTPNVSYGNNGPGQGEIYMRGLSSGFRGNQSSGTVSSFPNVATYLDEQSMAFPARNADIYMVDMNRIEILEGPQGTLFGGGAEAGAVRYITNKPKLDTFEGKAEGAYEFTSDGAPSTKLNVMLNVPIVQDKFAVRAVIYDEKQGGYIDNVASDFTRSNQDLGNYYFGIPPVGGLCPNGQPPGPAGCTITTNQQYNNANLVQKDWNPVTYQGARLEALYQINDDWNVLITESLQKLDAEGLSVQYPVGSNFQPLQPLQITAFEPSFNKDRYQHTSWTINGKIGVLKAIYTGGYTTRKIKEQLDYTNYSRSGGGMYYECVGGSTGWGAGTPSCYSPLGFWEDTVRSTHWQHEFRVSTPDDWRFRAIAGAYYEDFHIYDVMNFDYKTIPSCTPQNLATALGGGPVCVANVRTFPGTTTNDPTIRGDNVGFGEDTQRGYNQLAFYGSIDFDIIPNVLTISGGTRYYRYSEFEVGSQYGTNTSCLNVPNGMCGSGMVNIDSHNDHVVYTGFKSRAGVTWHIDQDNMAYFLFSQGFRPGAFNRSQKAVLPGPGGTPQFLEPNGYAPDQLTNYEVGYKANLLDHRLQLGISAYWMQWDNVQFLLFDPPFGINTTFGLNGPSYDVKGVEVQATARLMDGLTLQGSASYNDDKVASAPCLVSNIAASPTNGHCITQAIAKGSPALVSFPSPFGSPGDVAPFAPKFQGNLRLRYDWRFMDYNAFWMVGGDYVGSTYNQPATYPSGDGVLVPYTTYLRYKQPAFGTIQASIGVSKGNWSAEIYGTNLNNSNASTFTSSAQFIKSEVPLRPRTVGAKLGVSF